MLKENTVVDSIMKKIMEILETILHFLIDLIFSNNFITVLFWYMLWNVVAIYLMKKDKNYAQNNQRRIRESTLLTVAFAGGALGMYYAMYHYKHKTLHKRFTILVPLFIVLHFALVSYMVISNFVV